jgi:hypothetical protein
MCYHFMDGVIVRQRKLVMQVVVAIVYLLSPILYGTSTLIIMISALVLCLHVNYHIYDVKAKGTTR